jgi:hypothetical protein
MNMIRFYLDDRIHSAELPEEQRKYRVFAHIDNTNFWAVEWTHDDEAGHTVITDLNAGFISGLVEEACRPLKELTADEIRTRFAAFGDYIVRCVGGFRSYMNWISPDPENSGIALRIPRAGKSMQSAQKSP